MAMLSRRWRWISILPLLAACTPKAPPLAGTPAPVAAVPPTGITGFRRVVFNWSYAETDYSARGEGAARVAAPDSVRLDLFLAGGMGSGRVYVIGDTIDVPDLELLERVLPSAAMVWATLGRLAVPANPDTTVRVDGDTIRADIGAPASWRAAFVGGKLVRLERLDGGRRVEWVARATNGDVRWENERAHRTLHLSRLRIDSVAAFDPSIWRR